MFGCLWHTPSSLINSTMNPNVKTMKGYGVGVHSLTHNSLGVEGLVGTSGWGLRWVTSGSISHMELHKPKKQVG